MHYLDGIAICSCLFRKSHSALHCYNQTVVDLLFFLRLKLFFHILKTVSESFTVACMCFFFFLMTDSVLLLPHYGLQSCKALWVSQYLVPALASCCFLPGPVAPASQLESCYFFLFQGGCFSPLELKMSLSVQAFLSLCR